MPMSTLTLPSRMIDAASTYAARESLSLPRFFEMLLHRQYGYEMTIVVEKPAVANRKIAISPRVHALRGVARTSDSRSYRDIVADAVIERYEALG